MASFYKRKLKSGEFWYVDLVLSDGRRKSINTKCETKAAAKEVAVEFQRKILLGLDPTKPEPPKQNVIALFERFIQDETRNGARETVAMYKDPWERLSSARLAATSHQVTLCDSETQVVLYPRSH